MANTFVRKRKAKRRIGGRGCPNCGSHNSDGLRTRDGKLAAAWCYDCQHRWVPCSPHCRGYTLLVRDPKRGTGVFGCTGCGVPDHIAQLWPEAYRKLAAELTGQKLRPVV